MEIIIRKQELNLGYNASSKEFAETIAKDYTFGAIKPVVIVDNEDVVILNYDLPNTLDEMFNDICNKCNKQQFDSALMLIDVLLQQFPLHVDAIRTKAQIMMFRGDYKEACILATQACQLNALNTYNWILKGNIHNQMKENVEAIHCYEKVLQIDPDNIMAKGNIGAMYLQSGQLEEASKTFSNLIKVDNTYANAYLGLAQAYMGQQEWLKAFETIYNGVMLSSYKPENKEAYDSLIPTMFDIANKIASKLEYQEEIDKVEAKLEKEGGLPIRFEKDGSLQVYAQM